MARRRNPPPRAERPAPPEAVEQSASTSRVTSYDVAQRAGVSQSAVSRCLQPGASASAKMRARVLRAARELGYTPNAMARSLITRRSDLIAVLMSNLTSLYYPEVLSELAAQASASGVRILLFALPREGEINRVVDQILQYQVDGVVAAAMLSAEQVAVFAKRQVPVVFFNRYLREVPVNAVCCDQIAGARDLVSRLHAAGHRRFGVVAGPQDSVVGEERLQGSLNRLSELGIHDVPVARGSYDYESGANALHELVKVSRRPLQAVICANDVMAIGCIDAARHDLSLDVPSQLSVVGFDGVGPAAWSSYRLTTVRQPVQRMAEATIQLLMDRVANPALAPEKRVFSGEFVEGRSARLASRAKSS